MIDDSDSFSETVEQIRATDGDGRDDKPEWADQLGAQEELGINQGLPLVGEDYESYPSGQELLFPSNREFLTRLIEHRLVNSYSDAAAEVHGADADTVEKACNLFDIDARSHFSANPPEPETIGEEGKVVLGETAADETHVRSPPHRDSRVLTTLYGLGLSSEDISLYLSQQGFDCSTSDVERAAKNVGLLE